MGYIYIYINVYGSYGLFNVVMMMMMVIYEL